MQRTVEDCINIDVRWLKKTKRFINNSFGELSWSRGGSKSGAINYEMYEDRMVLKFRHKSYSSSDWQDVKQTVYFLETECNYGGLRKWFSCPNCAKRVAILYAPNTYFYCRQCYKLPYRSTLESKSDRMYSRKHGLGAEIFEVYESGRGYFKKKGMHYKTFNRKLVEYRKLEAQLNAHSYKLIQKLNGSLSRS